MKVIEGDGRGMWAWLALVGGAVTKLILDMYWHTPVYIIISYICSLTS